MPIAFKIKVMTLNGDFDFGFPSISQFASHLGLSESRLRLKLGERRCLSPAEYEELNQYAYQPIVNKHSGKDRKKT